MLQHILQNKSHQLRVAVIVNDMGELNIDANLVAKSGVLKREEQLVRLENGCICCTLRVDLLEEITKIAKDGEVDYIIIESSGISEPMQVAETFAFELPADEDNSEANHAGHTKKHAYSSLSQQQHPVKQAKTSGDSSVQKGGIPSMQLDELFPEGKQVPLLRDLAVLDTCVTVVDVANFFDVFDDPRCLAEIEEHRDQLPDQDTRTLTDLLCDQIEFADVIVLNKTDLVSASDIEAVEKMIRKFNSYAKIMRSVKGQVSPDAILGTKLFSFERAAAQEGWHESLTIPHVPETEEYGIGSFLYSARRPFHPYRLTELLQQAFVIVECPDIPPLPTDEDDASEEEEGEEEEEDEKEGEDETMEQTIESLDSETIQKRLEGKKNGLFKNLLRSKGIFWLGTRPKNYGAWSQAGLYCTLSNAGMWIAEFPEEKRTHEMRSMKNYDALMAREFGDRGQEIVFIGRFSKEENQIASIRSALNSCLLTDDEMDECMQSKTDCWEDPFEPWTYYVFDDDEE
jgi:G3E family GTPase